MPFFSRIDNVSVYINAASCEMPLTEAATVNPIVPMLFYYSRPMEDGKPHTSPTQLSSEGSCVWPSAKMQPSSQSTHHLFLFPLPLLLHFFSQSVQFILSGEKRLRERRRNK